MSDEHPNTIAGVSNRLITALPSAMLLQLLINVCFIGALFWLLSEQNTSRERVLIPLLAACSKTIPLEAFPHGLLVAPKP